MKKGITLISGVLFLAITITATFIVYEAGMPVIKKMQAAAAVEKMKDVFSQLDEIIREVASEGRGSKRTIYFKVDPGKLVVNESNDFIYWELETDSKLLSPRTSKTFGNIVIGSNLNTYANETQFQGNDAYVLRNEHLAVYIKKIGSPNNYTSYTTRDLLLGMYNKDLSTWLDLENLEISIDNSINSVSGNGYTQLSSTGYNLPYATVTARMNSSYIDYYIKFTLESGADFLEIEVSMA